MPGLLPNSARGGFSRVSSRLVCRRLCGRATCVLEVRAGSGNLPLFDLEEV